MRPIREVTILVKSRSKDDEETSSQKPMLGRLCYGISTLTLYYAFLMIPGSIVLRYFGVIPAFVVTTIFFIVFVSVCWLKDWLLRVSINNLLVTLLCGLVFSSVGFYIINTAQSAPEIGPPGTNKMTRVEQTWFGTVFALMGIGVAGNSISSSLGED